nr:immunoglobulin light chain junction region [Macaca mulatta]MOX28549.1 immunoglobulin light chain junction region [Macaca mulatta]MOX32260.1 immunoglobulin light chain junction region [Macaca mulatta]MOX32441.1 immunoglobulin light chain junction region [Macaca mulatta]MOX32722.1 immunoglobulin light chain junction region [Macaca mulatta]
DYYCDSWDSSGSHPGLF